MAPSLKVKRALRSAARLPGRVPGVRSSSACNVFTPQRHEQPLVLLRVQVVGCTGLLTKDRNGHSDPFVIVSVLNTRQQTPVPKRNVNPTYEAKDATFDFELFVMLADKLNAIELVVWDKDLFGGDRLFVFNDPANKPFSVNLESTRASTNTTGTVQLKLGFAAPPNAQTALDFDDIYGELVKHSPPSLVSAPPTAGVGTICSHAGGPDLEDDGGLSSDDESVDEPEEPSAPPTTLTDLYTPPAATQPQTQGLNPPELNILPSSPAAPVGNRAHSTWQTAFVTLSKNLPQPHPSSFWAHIIQFPLADAVRILKRPQHSSDTSAMFYAQYVTWHPAIATLPAWPADTSNAHGPLPVPHRPSATACQPSTSATSLSTTASTSLITKDSTLAAQSIGEIINVGTNIKTPSLTVYLESEISCSSTLVKKVQQELAYTLLCTVMAAVEIWYDPDPSSTIIEEDSVFVESFFAILDEEIESINGGEDAANFQYLAYGQSPLGAGGMSPAGPGYSPSSPDIYSPTSPSFVPQSPFGRATSPFGTLPYATSPFYDCSRRPMSPTYSPTSPALNLTSPGYSPTSPCYSPTMTMM
ncbi:hypothetical protein Hypma_000605 [Hypsizygus marmoreus]|uniref:C2 domain-containing protein n=1 Tax=Hypsizygus marmoreus TaxID=39966 RepID=A0A369JHE1_HYPMA|nr:hypothetical protein Hypma_000605 [Hypsizygus marmoreus]